MNRYITILTLLAFSSSFTIYSISFSDFLAQEKARLQQNIKIIEPKHFKNGLINVSLCIGGLTTVLYSWYQTESSKYPEDCCSSQISLLLIGFSAMIGGALRAELSNDNFGNLQRELDDIKIGERLNLKYLQEKNSIIKKN